LLKLQLVEQVVLEVAVEVPKLVYLNVAQEEVVAGSSNLPLLGAVEEALAL
jgi:hypothetical protein